MKGKATNIVSKCQVSDCNQSIIIKGLAEIMRRVGPTLLLAATATAFSVQRTGIPRASASAAAVDPITKAPGDPSLIMTTNVALQDKAAFVKSASAAVAAALSKPESYVAVCITDNNADGMSFGGSTDPTALGCVCKLRCKPQIICIVGGLHRLTMYALHFPRRFDRPDQSGKQRGADRCHLRAAREARWRRKQSHLYQLL